MSFSEWKEVELGEVILFNPRESLKKGSIAKKIGMDKLEPFNRKVQGFKETEFKSGTKFRNGDTLLARITPCLENGKTAQVEILDKNEVGFGSTEFLVLREKENKTINDFIYYLSISKDFRNIAIKSMTGTSGRQRVQKDILEKTVIRLPLIEEQKAIANILSTLDEKIETNNQINKKLEEMAQVIFKHWFVDFEFPCLPENYKFSRAGKPNDYAKVLTYKRVGGLPIPDGKSWFVYVLLCDDGSFYKGMTNDLYRRFYEHYTGIGAEWTKIHKPVKVIHYEKFNSQQEARKREEELKSGYGREWIKREYKKYQEGLPAHKMKEGLPAHQSRLMMAGEMVESEMGMIPKGWRVVEINNVANLTMGLSPKSSSYNSNGVGIPLLNGAADFEKGLIDAKKFTTKSTRLCKKNDLVFCVRATIGNITFSDKEYCLGRGVASLTPKSDEFTGIIYFNLLMSMNKLIANATGSVILGLSKPDINNLKLVLPAKKTLERFSEISNSILESKHNNEFETKKLVDIRDTLLPKLMSGEIRVPLE